MPWTRKQQKTAQAIEHGWKSKGSAEGFTKKFAAQVVAESESSDYVRRKKAAEKHMGKGARPAEG